MKDIQDLDEGFDQQLGPFYDGHGPEIIPSGFEESILRIADTMGVYAVSSNLDCFPNSLTIGHYDLTKYIQEEWDRLTVNPPLEHLDFPRRGFLMSSKSPSQAAGRAAEEIVLEKLLWRLRVGTDGVTKVHWFYDALDEGLVVKAKGVGSDDYLVQLTSGRYMLVESKASFRGSPENYVRKASQQLSATCAVNESVDHIMLALTDLTRKTIKLIYLDLVSFKCEPHRSLQNACLHLA